MTKNTIIQNDNYWDIDWKDRLRLYEDYGPFPSEAKENNKTNNKSDHFNKIRNKLKSYEIDIKKCSKYNEINSIRILNNSFKHNDGYYIPDNKSYNQINQDILNRWNILNNTNSNKIDYSKLPIKEIILDCYFFTGIY